jgi:hypothetical protein
LSAISDRLSRNALRNAAQLEKPAKVPMPTGEEGKEPKEEAKEVKLEKEIPKEKSSKLAQLDPALLQKLMENVLNNNKDSNGARPISGGDDGMNEKLLTMPNGQNRYEEEVGHISIIFIHIYSNNMSQRKTGQFSDMLKTFRLSLVI